MIAAMRAPRISIIQLLWLLLAAAPAFAQTDVDADFDLPGSAIDEVGSLGLDLGDADFVGNPSSGMFSGWPEDLVLVPIPGRSPQIGWNLTLAGGYFMELDGSEEEVSPSVIGGFGMYAENGSYAYGFGGNFHLLGDDLRVKAGAGYVDVRYRYWGRNQEANDLGISLDILQDFWNVPEFNDLLTPAMRYIGEALDGSMTPEAALRALADEHDKILRKAGHAK